MATLEQGGSGHHRVKAAAQRGLTTAQTTPWFRTVGMTAWLIIGRGGRPGRGPAAHGPGRRGRHPAGRRRRAGGAAGAAHRPPRAVAGSPVARRHPRAHRQPGPGRRGRRGHRRRPGQPERRDLGAGRELPAAGRHRGHRLGRGHERAGRPRAGRRQPARPRGARVLVQLREWPGRRLRARPVHAAVPAQGLDPDHRVDEPAPRPAGAGRAQHPRRHRPGLPWLRHGPDDHRRGQRRRRVRGRLGARRPPRGDHRAGVVRDELRALHRGLRGRRLRDPDRLRVRWAGRRAGHAGDRAARQQHHPERRGAVRVRHPAAAAPPRRAAHRDHRDHAVRRHGSRAGGTAHLGRRQRVRAAAKRGHPGRRPPPAADDIAGRDG